MGVATTTDTTHSVRTSFEMLKNLYEMPVQVVETIKKENEKKSAILTRAPLGYCYNAPHWGGGAISSPPPLISESTGPILIIQASFESPGKTVKGKQILLTSRSRVT